MFAKFARLIGLVLLAIITPLVAHAETQNNPLKVPFRTGVVTNGGAPATVEFKIDGQWVTSFTVPEGYSLEDVTMTGEKVDGHPEAGCTDGPDNGLDWKCDQGQENESGNLAILSLVAQMFDAGAAAEHWSKFDRVVATLTSRDVSGKLTHCNCGEGPGSFEARGELVFQPIPAPEPTKTPVTPETTPDTTPVPSTTPETTPDTTPVPSTTPETTPDTTPVPSTTPVPQTGCPFNGGAQDYLERCREMTDVLIRVETTNFCDAQGPEFHTVALYQPDGAGKPAHGIMVDYGRFRYYAIIINAKGISPEQMKARYENLGYPMDGNLTWDMIERLTANPDSTGGVRQIDGYFVLVQDVDDAAVHGEHGATWSSVGLPASEVKGCGSSTTNITTSTGLTSTTPLTKTTPIQPDRLPDTAGEDNTAQFIVMLVIALFGTGLFVYVIFFKEVRKNN